MHLVHIENGAGNRRSRRDIEQAEEPALPEHRKHKVTVVAQAVIEGEKDPVRAWGPLHPIYESLACDKAIGNCERVKLTLEIGEREIRKMRQTVCARPDVVIHHRLHTLAPLSSSLALAFRKSLS